MSPHRPAAGQAAKRIRPTISGGVAGPQRLDEPAQLVRLAQLLDQGRAFEDADASKSASVVGSD